MTSGQTALRRQRRLPEKLLALAHQACDLGEADLAHSLLLLSEQVMKQRGASWEIGRRRIYENLTSAYERVWFLKHPPSPPDIPETGFSQLRSWLEEGYDQIEDTPE
ncbi:MAG: hypothetical protein LKH33_11120 [Acetobacter sp.]|nr:hypothetical protein [Acetobacter sp.]MCH4062802.1 hypothetical protein [Acetobacter sp.]MCH4088355.1 hypothetical protein [Acetobacter sp.]MCI1294798.1 hypothetical protein [Acetobacter sp.]MCI1321463.1 hypothetical protein [Acetobacter sp.]